MIPIRTITCRRDEIDQAKTAILECRPWDGESYDPAKNGLGCYDLAIACKRAEVEAGRKLTPAEMVEMDDHKVAQKAK